MTQLAAASVPRERSQEPMDSDSHLVSSVPAESATHGSAPAEILINWNADASALLVRTAATTEASGLSFALQIPLPVLSSLLAERHAITGASASLGSVARDASHARPRPRLRVDTERTSRTLAETERASIAAAILEEEGNLTQAAASLAIARSTLYLKLRKYGLEGLLTRQRARERESKITVSPAELKEENALTGSSELPSTHDGLQVVVV